MEATPLFDYLPGKIEHSSAGHVFSESSWAVVQLLVETADGNAVSYNTVNGTGLHPIALSNPPRDCIDKTLHFKIVDVEVLTTLIKAAEQRALEAGRELIESDKKEQSSKKEKSKGEQSDKKTTSKGEQPEEKTSSKGEQPENNTTSNGKKKRNNKKKNNALPVGLPGRMGAPVTTGASVLEGPDIHQQYCLSDAENVPDSYSSPSSLSSTAAASANTYGPAIHGEKKSTL